MKVWFPIVLLFSNSVLSQCLSGDCLNGIGKYDFAYAIYEGNFKDGKPNGKGIMDYGYGEKFEGNFINGQEDGDGIQYKNGIVTEVSYINGKVKERIVEKIIGGNAPKVEGCNVGDCYNGYGEVELPSGNKYKGNFLYGAKDGKGTFLFYGGNVLTAEFKQNFPTYGTFKYADKDVTFTGTFDENIEPKSGKYYYPAFKSTVEIENGQITNIDNPVARRADSLAIESAKPKTCSKCSGKGMVGGGTYSKTTENYYTIDYVKPDGNVARSSSGNVMKSTTMVNYPPTLCPLCNGTGQTQGGTIIMNPKYQH